MSGIFRQRGPYAGPADRPIATRRRQRRAGVAELKRTDVAELLAGSVNGVSYAVQVMTPQYNIPQSMRSVALP